VVDLRTDSMSRVEAKALEEELERNPGAPTIVVLSAGDINTEARCVETLARWHARREVAVDGAFGCGRGEREVQASGARVSWPIRGRRMGTSG